MGKHAFADVVPKDGLAGGASPMLLLVWHWLQNIICEGSRVQSMDHVPYQNIPHFSMKLQQRSYGRFPMTQLNISMRYCVFWGLSLVLFPLSGVTLALTSMLKVTKVTHHRKSSISQSCTCISLYSCIGQSSIYRYSVRNFIQMTCFPHY